MTAANAPYHFRFLDQNLFLLPQKAIFWEDRYALLLADLHLGKVEHFRKAGIAVPSVAAYKDYLVLDQILQNYPVHTVIILGDLFHSTYNKAWEDFSEWLANHAAVQFILVKGNHDILPDRLYKFNHIEIHNDSLIRHPFVFSHVPINKETQLYNLAGHIHPAIKLTGKGKQSVVLPCFYFGKYKGILPAFGQFTGKATIATEAGDHLFVILNHGVIPLPD